MNKIQERYLNEVHFEGWISASNAAFARLARALIVNKAQLLNSFHLGKLEKTTSIQLLIKLDCTLAEKFSKEAKINDLTYRSPTKFNNRNICPIYKNPEEEIAHKKENIAKTE